MLDRRHRSSAAPLGLAWMALVAYASLFPFEGWRWPPGASVMQMLALPWVRQADRFDLVANFLGYVPLGLLLAVARLRAGGGVGVAALVGLVVPSLLSFGLEVAQFLLPRRVPSSLDWVLNTGGAAAGALLAALWQWLGWHERWHAARQRWFHEHGASAFALLALWPVGLLFPAPVPLGLGQIWPAVSHGLTEALDAVPWAQPVVDWLAEQGPFEPLGLGAEWLAVTLGLLAPCLLSFTVTRGVARRVGLAVGASVLGFGVSTLASTLNFGPLHALAWLTPAVLPGLAVGLALALALSAVGPRLAAGLGLMVLTGLVALVTTAPTDPYFAHSLAAWEQGRFIRFHGAAQWVGWLWPYAAMLWLLWRLGAKD